MKLKKKKKMYRHNDINVKISRSKIISMSHLKKNLITAIIMLGILFFISLFFMDYTNYIKYFFPKFGEIVSSTKEDLKTIPRFYFGFYFIIIFIITTLFSKNPTYSLWSLVGIFIICALLLLTLQIEFLGYTLFIVYIGAIAILFLFVLMMYNLHQLNRITWFMNHWKSIYFILLFLPKFYVFTERKLINFIASINNFNLSNYLNSTDYLQRTIADIKIFSDLYNEHAFIFILTSIVLLVGLVGSIILALSTIRNKPKKK